MILFQHEIYIILFLIKCRQLPSHCLFALPPHFGWELWLLVVVPGCLGEFAGLGAAADKLQVINKTQ